MATYGTDFKLGIWEDNAGVPGALLATSNLLEGPGGGWQWHPNEPGTAVAGALVNGNVYWLGGWCESGQYKVQEAGSTNQTAYRDIVYDGTLPNPFGTPDGYLDYNLSIYATYTPAAGGMQLYTLLNEMGY